jgi:hypothetical protein
MMQNNVVMYDIMGEAVRWYRRLAYGLILDTMRCGASWAFRLASPLSSACTLSKLEDIDAGDEHLLPSALLFIII